MAELYYLVSYFLLYSFLGWVLEVVYHVLVVGKVINRGFLNGPVCPIYGFGMLSVLLILKPFSDNTLLLFAGGIFFATLIELIGGFVLYKMFHMRWWDYSEEPFNLGGYICLKYSIAWGFCIVFAMKVVHPFVELNVKILDGVFGHVVVAILWIIFFVDSVITVLTVTNLNKDLKEMNKIAGQIRKVSDHMTEKIGEHTIEADTKIQGHRVQATLARAEIRDRIEELKKKQAKNRFFGFNRLHQAFPQLKHTLYNEELHSLIEGLKEKRENKNNFFQKTK